MLPKSSIGKWEHFLNLAKEGEGMISKLTAQDESKLLKNMAA